MESMQNKAFDKELRKKVNGFSADVPDGLWEKIEEKLEEESTKKRGIKTFSIVRWISIAASLALVIGAMYWQFKPKEAIYLRKESGVLSVKEPAEKRMLTLPADDEVRRSVDDTRDKIGHPSKSQKNSTNAYVATEISSTSIQEKQTIPPERETPLSFVPQNTFENQEEVTPPQILVIHEIAPVLKNKNEERSDKKFGVSTILNLVVNKLNTRQENIVEFSESEEGIIQLDFNVGLAKNQRLD